MNAHPGEIIELEALTINGGEADANSVEVSLREIVGDIADNISASWTDLNLIV